PGRRCFSMPLGLAGAGRWGEVEDKPNKNLLNSSEGVWGENCGGVWGGVFSLAGCRWSGPRAADWADFRLATGRSDGLGIKFICLGILFMCVCLRAACLSGGKTRCL